MSTESYTSDIVLVQRSQTEHIRERPGMYIGDTGTTGLHHLASELVYNAIDDFLAGRATGIAVTLHADGSVSVADDGTAVPSSALVGRAFTEMYTPGIRVGGPYTMAGGLHGLGGLTVVALSEWATVDVRHDGRARRQCFRRGEVVGLVEDLGSADGTGTPVRFLPDATIFSETRFDFERMADRLRELAFVFAGLSCVLVDERDGQRAEFHSPNGSAEFAHWLARDSVMWHEPIAVHAVEGDLRIDAALVWTGDDEELVRGYANGAFNPSGGPHIDGLRHGAARAVRERIGTPGITVNDVGDGLLGVVSVLLPNPMFEAAARVRLYNPEVRLPILRAVEAAVRRFLRESPAADRILARIEATARERRSATAARQEDAKVRRRPATRRNTPV